MSAPERTCVACRTKQEKSRLIRIVRSEDTGVCIDERMCMDGRGAYLCKSRECVLKARKKGALCRALKAEIAGEFYDHLEGYIDEQTR